jgi:hypothetical protein
MTVAASTKPCQKHGAVHQPYLGFVSVVMVMHFGFVVNTSIP